MSSDCLPHSCIAYISFEWIIHLNKCRRILLIDLVLRHDRKFILSRLLVEERIRSPCHKANKARSSTSCVYFCTLMYGRMLDVWIACSRPRMINIHRFPAVTCICIRHLLFLDIRKSTTYKVGGLTFILTMDQKSFICLAIVK